MQRVLPIPFPYLPIKGEIKQLEFVSRCIESFSEVSKQMALKPTDGCQNNRRHSIQAACLRIVHAFYTDMKPFIDKEETMLNTNDCINIVVETFNPLGQDKPSGGIHLDFFLASALQISGMNEGTVVTIARKSGKDKLQRISNLLSSGTIDPKDFEYFLVPVNFAMMSVHMQSSKRHHLQELNRLQKLTANFPYQQTKTAAVSDHHKLPPILELFPGIGFGLFRTFKISVPNEI